MTHTPTFLLNIARGSARMPRVADHAPMVVTRLSGWINVGEGQAQSPGMDYSGGAGARR